MLGMTGFSTFLQDAKISQRRRKRHPFGHPLKGENEARPIE